MSGCGKMQHNLWKQIKIDNATGVGGGVGYRTAARVPEEWGFSGSPFGSSFSRKNKSPHIFGTVGWVVEVINNIEVCFCHVAR